VVHLPGLTFRNIVWSPDGSHLAVTSDEPAAIVLDFRGGTLRRLAAGNAEAFSPDGTQLAVTGPDAIIDVATGVAKRLDSAQIGAVYPGTVSWSPNGRWIAASADLVDLGTYDVHRSVVRINVETRDALELAPGEPGFTAWSANSTQIAVSAPLECYGQEQCRSRVSILDASGLNQVQVYEAIGGTGRPAWSPDGAHLAFNVGARGTSSPGIVHVVGTDGSGPRTLGEGFGDPAWTGAGTAVAWARVLPGGPTFGSLFATTLVDGVTKWIAEGIDLTVTDEFDGLLPPSAFAIAARGEMTDAVPLGGLPATTGDDVKEVTPAEPGEGLPAVLPPTWRGLGTFLDCAPSRLDLSARTLAFYSALLGVPASCRSVAWSPDGSAFLAVSDAGLVRVLVPDSNTHALSSDLEDVQGLTVSPRGNFVAVQACPKTRPSCDGSETTIVRLHGGEITSVLSGSNVTWSADERRLAVYTPDGLAVAAGDGTGLVAVPGIEREISWAPDGSRFATIVDGNVEVASWNGGERAPLTRFPVGGAMSVSWSPGGDRLVVFQGNRSLLVIAADASPVARVPFEGRIFDGTLQWAPDGSRFVVAAELYGGPHLVVVATDGSRAVDLPDADQPLFSPDSRFLAYLAGVSSGDLSIGIANADGSGSWFVPDPEGHLPGAWLGSTLTQ
jgi:Tol biopolymer transport system component